MLLIGVGTISQKTVGAAAFCGNVVFIKSFYAVVAQRNLQLTITASRNNYQLANQRKVRPALHQKLNDTGVWQEGRSALFARRWFSIMVVKMTSAVYWSFLCKSSGAVTSSGKTPVYHTNLAITSVPYGISVRTFAHKCSLVRTASVNYG